MLRIFLIIMKGRTDIKDMKEQRYEDTIRRDYFEATVTGESKRLFELAVLFLNLELRFKSCLIQNEDSFQARRPRKIIPKEYFKREDCLKAEDVDIFSCDLESKGGEC